MENIGSLSYNPCREAPHDQFWGIQLPVYDEKSQYCKKYPTFQYKEKKQIKRKRHGREAMMKELEQIFPTRNKRINIHIAFSPSALKPSHHNKDNI